MRVLVDIAQLLLSSIELAVVILFGKSPSESGHSESFSFLHSRVELGTCGGMIISAENVGP